jgi:hypothetical protein
MSDNYKLVKEESINIVSSRDNITELPTQIIVEAVKYTHEIFDKFVDFGVDVFGILGMRNLSAFVGEVFAKSLEIKSNGLLKSNPHQDGYPDLLLMDEQGLSDWSKLSAQLRDKAPFSPFANGGIEIKATCGGVPTPAQCKRRGVEKPDMGDQRIGVLKGYDWKAHHRETNNLIGILWDFIDRVPKIVALFYSSNLDTNDWGRIVQPREGGGRTTSVSIMTREGVRKMYDGTILVLNDRRYRDFINRHNGGNKL